MRGDDEVRECHYIKLNTKVSAPVRICCVDTETIGYTREGQQGRKHQKFRLGCMKWCELRKDKQTRSGALRFDDPGEFWSQLRYLCTAKSTLWLFAHNAGFDMTTLGLWDRIDDGTVSLADDLWAFGQLGKVAACGKKPWRGLLVLEDPPTIIRLKCGNSYVNIVDTMNYFPCSLATLGESFGLVKLPMPYMGDTNAAWMTYCERDVDITFRAVVELIGLWRRGKYGTWRYTASGLAWNAFRHGFMEHKILIHGHKKALQLERDAYYGGEVRCFYVGHVLSPSMRIDSYVDDEDKEANVTVSEYVHVLDVRSLFPSVMRGNLYPTKLMNYWEEPDESVVGHVLMNYACCARVSIESHDRAWPVRRNGITRYCRGLFTTTLAGPELLEAWKMNLIRTYHVLAAYESAELFTSYVDHFWERRRFAEQCGNKANSLLFKVLLNSLYGRFGMRAVHWENGPEEGSPKPWGTWLHGRDANNMPQLWRAIAWRSQRQQKGGEGPDSFPLIAAYVTSYARLRMAQLREIAGPENVYYQCTDSLHVSGQGYERLCNAGEVDPISLGKLRSIATAHHVRYYGPNHYRLGDKLICGGRHKDALQVDSVTWEQDRFARLHEIVTSGDRSEVWVDIQTVHVRPEHAGGIVSGNGWVKPFRLPVDDELAFPATPALR